MGLHPFEVLRPEHIDEGVALGEGGRLLDKAGLNQRLVLECIPLLEQPKILGWPSLAAYCSRSQPDFVNSIKNTSMMAEDIFDD